MSFKRVLQGIVVVCLPAASTSIVAQSSPSRPVLLALDLNHDDALSSAEITAASQSLMPLDKNGDGQLSMEECLPATDSGGARPEEMVKRLMIFDRNSNGSLTAEELPARMQGLFRRGDANHDGKLTAEEIQTMAAAQGAPAGLPTRAGQAGGPMRSDPVLNALDADHDGTLSAAEIRNSEAALKAADGNGDGQLSAEELRPRQASPKNRADHMFEEWDTNKDGKITKAEAPDRVQQQFERLDTNADGSLTEDELIVFFTQSAKPSTPSATDAQLTKEQK